MAFTDTAKPTSSFSPVAKPTGSFSAGEKVHTSTNYTFQDGNNFVFQDNNNFVFDWDIGSSWSEVAKPS